MNVGMMQLSNVQMTSVKQTNTKQSSQVANGEKGNQFGAIFNKMMNGQKTVSETNSTDGVDSNKLADLLNSESAEEVLSLLGIQHDDGLLMIQNANDQTMKSIDELMNVEDLLSLLSMDQAELQNILEKMFGQEQLEGNMEDVWQLIGFINEQAPNLVNQLATAIQGEHKVTPKEAEKLLEFLKLSQTIGKHADLLGEQPVQLVHLKQVLSEVVELTKLNEEMAQPSTKSTEITIQKSTLNALQGIKEVVTETKTTTDTQTTISVQQSVNTVPKTVTITLPVEKGAQGEALVKEVQQLIGRGQFSNTQGTMKLLLKLYPENLGSIRIEVMQKDGVLSLRLLASTAQAKELLDNQINQLKTSFAQANIQLDRVDIAQSLQDPERNLRDQNLFGNLFKQQEEQDENQNNNNDDDEEQMSFQDYLINEEV